MKRNTIQRSLVLNALNTLKNHPSADEVYYSVRDIHEGISKGTVYRNLNALADEGIIRRVAVANAADRFDHLNTVHYHFKCVRCGKFFDIEVPYISDIDKVIDEQTGNKLLEHEILFKGLCFDCNLGNKE